MSKHRPPQVKCHQCRKPKRDIVYIDVETPICKQCLKSRI